MKTIRFLSLAVSLILLSSCAVFSGKEKDVRPDYLDSGVKMNIKNFFSGDIEISSIVQDKNNKIIDSNTSKINGKWVENEGIIRESIFYNNGLKDSRTWIITVNSDNTFDVIMHDIASLAHGSQAGNSAHISYDIIVTKRDSANQKEIKENMNIERVMYVIDDKSMIMISRFKKKNGESGIITSSLKKIN